MERAAPLTARRALPYVEASGSGRTAKRKGQCEGGSPRGKKKPDTEASGFEFPGPVGYTAPGQGTHSLERVDAHDTAVWRQVNGGRASGVIAQ